MGRRSGAAGSRVDATSDFVGEDEVVVLPEDGADSVLELLRAVLPEGLGGDRRQDEAALTAGRLRCVLDDAAAGDAPAGPADGQGAGRDRTDRARAFIIGGIGVTLVVVLAFGLVSRGGDDSPGRTSDGETDSTQLLYNAFLEQARSDVREDPDLNCDPRHQQRVIDSIEGASGGDKAILQRAMGDACIEAGAYELDLEYSPYYDDAPR